jgi:hypothetical protein
MNAEPTIHMWPWLALSLVLGILAVAVIHGSAAGILAFGCFVTFWIACLRGIKARTQSDAVRRAGTFYGFFGN